MVNDQDILDGFKQIAESSVANDKALLELIQVLITRVLELYDRLDKLERRLDTKVDRDV